MWPRRLSSFQAVTFFDEAQSVFFEHEFLDLSAGGLGIVVNPKYDISVLCQTCELTDSKVGTGQKLLIVYPDDGSASPSLRLRSPPPSPWLHAVEQ